MQRFWIIPKIYSLPSSLNCIFNFVKRNTIGVLQKKMEIYYRNWLMCLWRPISPAICRLQAEEPGKLVAQFHPESKTWEVGAGGVSHGLRLKGQEPGAQRRQEEMDISAQAENASTTLLFVLFECPVDWMMVTTLGRAGHLLSLPIKHWSLPETSQGQCFIRYLGIL